MTETEVIEMFVPSVSRGCALGIPDLKVTLEDTHAYDEIAAEHVERGDFHDIGAFMAENLPTVENFYNFIVPTENVILSIANQAEAQFKARNLPKRLAIVGFADSKKDAPYKDPGFEIWGLNDLHGIIPRWTRWFDIHTPEVIDIDVKAGRAPPDKCGIGGLSKLTCPIYMQERNPAVPNSVKFPLDEILQTFSKLTGARYFTNSISYMIAYALYEGIITGHQWDEIHVYGVESGNVMHVPFAQTWPWVRSMKSSGRPVNTGSVSEREWGLKCTSPTPQT